MPELLQRGQRQFTTEQANNSRLVTIQRWVVEARNGHLKSMFKFLANRISITHVPNLGAFLRICGAIINKYHPTIHMERANDQLASILLQRVNGINMVQARVENEMLHTRNAQRWVALAANLVNDFPILSISYIQDFNVGVYQVHLAPGYIQDKTSHDDEEFQVEMLRGENRVLEPGFLRTRVKSRFRNSKIHQQWIQYVPTDSDNEHENETEPILGHYCTCITGARTIGTCAHITSVLWYLGFAQHEENVKYPSTLLTNTIPDAAQRPPQH